MNANWAQVTAAYPRNVTSLPTMSATETVNFKAYHEDEIRRLTVDQDVSTNYDYLCAKLGHVFPSLKRENFQLAWTDNEGDEIRISSSEELVIALNEMTGSPYRIRIVQAGVPKAETKVGPPPPPAHEAQGEQPVHVNVTCDNCDGQVKGYRYKCVVCPDYDLCQTCEAQSVHPEHSMIRIPKPEITWPGHLYRRLSKLNSRNEKRQQRMSGNAPEMGQDALKGPWGCRGPRSGGPMGPFGPHGPRGPMGSHPPFGGAQRFFDSMRCAWLGEEPTPGQSPNPQPSGFVSGNDGNGPSESRASDQARRQEEVVQLLSPMLKSMGVTIERKEKSLILQITEGDKFPFNADLIFRNIETHFGALLVGYGAQMKTDPDQRRIVVTFENLPEAPESPESQEPTAEPEVVVCHDHSAEPSKPTGSVEIPVTVTQSVTKTHTHTEAAPTTSSEPARQSPESEEEWILLKEPAVGTKPKTNYEVPIQVSNQPASVLYPELPKSEQTQPPPKEEGVSKPQEPEKVTQAAVEHADPRVRTSMQAMRNMGFSNMELLMPLLEEKNGDIGQVLEMIFQRSSHVRK